MVVVLVYVILGVVKLEQVKMNSKMRPLIKYFFPGTAKIYYYIVHRLTKSLSLNMYNLKCRVLNMSPNGS
jgi:hypothetical protein